MELISGHTLRELIHKGERVPLKRALEIGEGILAAFFIAGRTAILKTSESRVEQLRREDVKGIEWPFLG